MTLGGSARAAERAVTLAIPAQPLSRALTALMRQSQVDIIFAPGSVDDRKAPALRGRLTPSEVRARLLAGSGLEFQMIEPGAYVIRARRDKTPTIADFVQVIASGAVTYSFHVSTTSTTTDPVIGATSDASTTATLAPSNSTWADFANSDQFGQLVQLYGGYTTAVGAHAAGVSWCGRYDMAGNAYE